MGTGKKEKTRKEKQAKVGDGMGNVKVKGENFYRTGKQAKTLNMFKDGKAQRNASGKVTKAASFQDREKPKARVEPNRKWFNATRVISQDALDNFRSAMQERVSDPYQILLKSNKLPMSLIRDGEGKNGLKQHQAKMQVESAPFGDTFGPKAQRKRVKLGVGSLDDLAGESTRMHVAYLERIEEAKLLSGTSGLEEQAGEAAPEGAVLSSAIEPIFSKGQSKRIWNELYKVIDSSDVVIHVLDARDPLGTRCRSVEKYIREEAPHKHLIFVLNKCDLVPTGVAFSSLHSNRKQISVGFIGYPNTGKSSIINTLRKKKVCTVAPIPGETKVWQYITLMKRIYLIDCPGVVPPSNNDSPEDILLRGVVRVENVENPEQYIAAVLKKTKPQHIQRTYDIGAFETATQFLELLARKGGRLLKGGEADVDGAAKMVLNDFVRGKLPWFTPPPVVEGQEGGKGIEGRKGVLGEMGKVRTARKDDAAIEGADVEMDGLDEVGNEDEEEFEGFEEQEDEDMESSDEASSADEPDIEQELEQDITGEIPTTAGGVVLEAG
ncbi:GTPase required for pre-60S ribosomal subunit nuclear export and maturation [Imshaugia aleurites]|uniref:Nucleolar GTP-binding protein 2 n=1 Tax=Imshaugia aleurites TaxID=172621 RepID=A0A8H3FSW5_9LECA|nr:GTPase required for pre-60S ribosomal subunit nuclear export and maturation [Imshaugia aleurites]